MISKQLDWRSTVLSRRHLPGGVDYAEFGIIHSCLLAEVPGAVTE